VGDVQAVSFWVKLAHPSLQPHARDELYLLDAQQQPTGAAKISTHTFGSLWWMGLYLDGVLMPPQYTNINFLQSEQWLHIHAEAHDLVRAQFRPN
jgi:hypothetical protein